MTNTTLIGNVLSGIDRLSARQVLANAGGAENAAPWLSQHKLPRLIYSDLFVLMKFTTLVLHLPSALHHFLLLQDQAVM